MVNIYLIDILNLHSYYYYVRIPLLLSLLHKILFEIQIFYYLKYAIYYLMLRLIIKKKDEKIRISFYITLIYSHC
jgi:hypothetical protein